MGKQFIERNQAVIGVVSAVLIVITLIAALTVTREDLTGGYQITVEFADANGLAGGDIAMVAGIQAGKVLEVDIVDDHVEALVQMQGGVQLPTTTRASITVRTLVGKKAIDLDTGAVFAPPFLDDGDTIPLQRTSVTLDVPALTETAEDFLTEIDSEALNTLLVAVADVTRDQREEVAGLVESGNELTTLVNSQEAQIRTLLRNLSQLSQTLQSRDEELVGIIDDLDVAMADLAARRADVQALLRETQSTSTLTADFIARVRADLDAILDEVALDLEIVRRHQVDIAEALAYSGDALVGYSSISYAQDLPVEWGHVFVTSAGPLGLDVIAGCGGLLDQQLDALLGPDPRSCAEQGVSSTPASPDQPPPPSATDGGSDAEAAPPPVPPGATVVRQPQELGIDIGPRSLLAAIGGGGA